MRPLAVADSSPDHRRDRHNDKLLKTGCHPFYADCIREPYENWVSMVAVLRDVTLCGSATAGYMPQLLFLFVDEESLNFIVRTAFSERG